MNVPVSQLGVEMIRASWSRPVWAIMTAVASIAVGVVFALMVVTDAQAAQSRAQTLESKGWGLVTMSSAAGEVIDARACAAAADVPGVLAVGAVGTVSQTEALGLDAGLGLTEVTTEVPRIVWPQTSVDAGAAALATPGFQALSGLRDGVLHLRLGGTSVPITVAGIDGPGRFPAIDGGLLALRGDVASPAYCLVDLPPDQVEALALDLAAATASYGILAVPVLSSADAAPTPADIEQSHRDRHLPVIVAAFLFVAALLRWMTARRDRAIYRLLGFGRIDLWTMGLMEYALLLGVPWASAFATVLAWSQLRGIPTQAIGALDLALAMGGSAVVAVIFATLCAAGRNTHQFAPGA